MHTSRSMHSTSNVPFLTQKDKIIRLIFPKEFPAISVARQHYGNIIIIIIAVTQLNTANTITLFCNRFFYSFIYIFPVGAFSEMRGPIFRITLAIVPSRRYRRRQAYEYRQDLMYLSMVMCIFISFPHSVVLICQRHFVVKFWLSGSFRVRSWG